MNTIESAADAVALGIKAYVDAKEKRLTEKVAELEALIVAQPAPKEFPVEEIRSQLKLFAEQAVAAVFPDRLSKEELLAELESQVVAAVTLLPRPKDGQDGQNGQNGEPGPAGRDAAQLDILLEIEPAKAYLRGTWAKERGGLVRAWRNTDPLAAGKGLADCGWEVMVDGVQSVVAEMNDDRDLVLRTVLTSGAESVQTATLPVMVWRDIYVASKQYRKDDVVTSGGSMHIAVRDTTAVPGTSSDWKLCVKHGRDGRDAAAVKSAPHTSPVSLK
jgi:hypothetical protein